MNTKLIISALSLAIVGTSAFAQYVGPNGSATSVKQLQESAYDHAPVVLKGHITGRLAYDDLYQFNDGTGAVMIKIDHWPLGLVIDEKTKVEITGKYDREFAGFNKVKVIQMRRVD